MQMNEINDLARREIALAKELKSIPCEVVLTRGIADTFKPDRLAVLFGMICEYDDFNADNDPADEHDMVFLNFDNDTNVMCKFDYYDNSLEYGSENPLDLSATTRVFTIMLSREY